MADEITRHFSSFSLLVVLLSAFSYFWLGFSYEFLLLFICDNLSSFDFVSRYFCCTYFFVRV
ncbi:hypothetical protein GCM10026986_09160 [Nitrincola alkalisediminis]